MSSKEEWTATSALHVLVVIVFGGALFSVFFTYVPALFLAGIDEKVMNKRWRAMLTIFIKAVIVFIGALVLAPMTGASSDDAIKFLVAMVIGSTVALRDLILNTVSCVVLLAWGKYSVGDRIVVLSGVPTSLNDYSSSSNALVIESINFHYVQVVGGDNNKTGQVKLRFPCSTLLFQPIIVFPPADDA